MISNKQYARVYYLKNKKRLDKYRRKWAKENVDKESAYKSKWLKKNLNFIYEWEKKRDPKIRKAYFKVRNALKSGEIKRNSCLKCKNKNVHAHHENYNKPLKIIWLCPFHHKQLHRKLLIKV